VIAHDVLLLGMGFVLLLAGAEMLVRAAARLGEALGVPPFLVGLLLVGFGTSAPELAVGVDAALVGSGDVAVGNVIGSNLCNGALILGLAAMLTPVVVPRRLLRIETPLLIATSAAAAIFLRDSTLQRGEALLLVVALVFYLGATLRGARAGPTLSRAAAIPTIVPWGARAGPTLSRAAAIPTIVPWRTLTTKCSMGIALLIVGAHWLVEGTILVARDLGVSEAAIAISAVAFGTSLPEVATTAAAARHRASDLAVGNLIGSNLFNVMAVLGLSGLVAPLQAADIRAWELVVFVGAPVLFAFLAVRGRIGGRSGVALVLGYGGFVAAAALDL
jgi:cation:H+ antiporter